MGEKEQEEDRKANVLDSGGGFNPTERYWELMKESQIKGYLFQQQNYLPGDENPGG